MVGHIGVLEDIPGYHYDFSTAPTGLRPLGALVDASHWCPDMPFYSIALIYMIFNFPLAPYKPRLEPINLRILKCSRRPGLEKTLCRKKHGTNRYSRMRCQLNLGTVKLNVQILTSSTLLFLYSLYSVYSVVHIHVSFGMICPSDIN
jgi:hypothetical protein